MGIVISTMKIEKRFVHHVEIRFDSVQKIKRSGTILCKANYDFTNDKKSFCQSHFFRDFNLKVALGTQ